jgi:hypothetical protein
MQILRTVCYVPVMLIGAIFFGLGTALLLVGRHIKPDSAIFDRWIDGIIDGSKDKPAIKATAPPHRRLAVP